MVAKVIKHKAEKNTDEVIVILTNNNYNEHKRK